MFEYGELYQTLYFKYNEKGLETNETYFNGKNKWEGSYETVYNERNQEIAVYKLNKKEKRKSLLSPYEYEY